MAASRHNTVRFAASGRILPGAIRLGGRSSRAVRFTVNGARERHAPDERVADKRPIDEQCLARRLRHDSLMLGRARRRWAPAERAPRRHRRRTAGRSEASSMAAEPHDPPGLPHGRRRTDQAAHTTRLASALLTAGRQARPRACEPRTGRRVMRSPPTLLQSGPASIADRQHVRGRRASPRDVARRSHRAPR